MRLRRGCVETAAIFAIGFLAFVTALLAAIYVHESARQWEVPAIFASLALGLLPTLWYWRARRFGWVAGILAAELLAFSFSSAVFHGWMTQATMLIAVATVVVAVALFVGIARFSRRFESVTRAAV